jgi:hypothetical protein
MENGIHLYTRRGAKVLTPKFELKTKPDAVQPYILISCEKRRTSAACLYSPYVKE